MGHEPSVATSLASGLVDCVMRTSAVIVILGQSLCPHRLAAALGKGELGQPQRSYAAPWPRQGQATCQWQSPRDVCVCG